MSTVPRNVLSPESSSATLQRNGISSAGRGNTGTSESETAISSNGSGGKETAATATLEPHLQRAELDPCAADDDGADLYVVETEPVATRHSAAACVQAALAECRILTADGEQELFKRLKFVSFRAEAIEKSFETGRRTKKKLSEVNRLRSEASVIRDEIATANLRLVASIAGARRPQ